MMAYADEILRVRDVDSMTELLIERLDGDAGDEAVLDISVTIGYGLSEPKRGYVRLTEEYAARLAKFLADHCARLERERFVGEVAGG